MFSVQCGGYPWFCPWSYLGNTFGPVHGLSLVLSLVLPEESLNRTKGTPRQDADIHPPPWTEQGVFATPLAIRLLRSLLVSICAENLGPSCDMFLHCHPDKIFTLVSKKLRVHHFVFRSTLCLLHLRLDVFED